MSESLAERLSRRSRISFSVCEGLLEFRDHFFVVLKLAVLVHPPPQGNPPLGAWQPRVLLLLLLL